MNRAELSRFTCGPVAQHGYCCPLHMVTGGFSPDRRRVLLSQLATAGPTPSLMDLTPKVPSRHCTYDDSATRGLYERVPPERLLLFRNATVLTMRDGRVLDGHDVVVRDGRIDRVMPTGAAVAHDALVIDATGKTLLPGLSEIHAHMWTGTWASAFAPMAKDGGDGSVFMLPYDLQLFQQLANGITRMDIMAGCPDALWMRNAIRDGRLAGPALRVGSPMIDGHPVMHAPTMSYVVGDRDGGRRAAELIHELGFDFAKPYTNLPAEGYEGMMDVCERRGIPVMGHVPKAVGIEEAVRRGQHGIAHVAELFYNEVGPERRDPGRRERLVRMLADAGTWLQATVSVMIRLEWYVGDDPLPPNVPDVHHMNPFQRALWAPESPFLQMIRGMPDIKHFGEDGFALACAYTRAAQQAGVRVLTGTDFPNPYVVDGFSLHEELMHFTTRCGFTPYDALYASTRRAAEYHGAAQSDGRVEVGGRAELVVLDGNPLTDIHATRRVDTVLAGSYLLRRRGIEEGWARVRRAYESMPPVTIQVSRPHDAVGGMAPDSVGPTGG